MSTNETIFKIKHFYFLKPLIPRRLQIYLRSQIVRHRIPVFSDVWPIDKNAGHPPENWTGWPEGKKFAFVLTHDIETEKGLKKYQSIMEMEENFNLRSSFNFVAKDYHVTEEIRSNLQDRGFEVGLHGLSHNDNPFISKKVFDKQKAEINRIIKEWNCVGFRCPSMLHNLDYVHELNVEYDASTFDTDPFEPQPDGLGTIFPQWIPHDSRKTGYVELPYTLPQDFLLFILMKEKKIDIWKRKVDWIVQQGGMVLVNTHPDYMNFNRSQTCRQEYPARYYEELLTYIKEKYAGQYWHALPREAARFWAEKYNKNKTKEISVLKHEKKRIWIDLDNSPHVPFFKPIIDELRARDHDVFITARDCFQVCGLADLMHIKYKKIGRHYGKNILFKAIGLMIRAYQLAPTLRQQKPHLALSHGSRSQVMISTLLNIPSIVIGDYEHSEPVFKPSYAIVPELISDSDIKGFRKAVYKYPGIKEDVYVPNFLPDRSILRELGIKEEELLVTIRPPATEAHYHNPESETLFKAVLDFLGSHENTRIVVLPRNEKKQTAWVKNQWSELCETGKIIIPGHVVDGLNLIWHSDLVISGGGTMNREAAALGVPVYSIFRGVIGAVDRYLAENGRLVLLTDVEDIRAKIVLQKRERSTEFESANHAALYTIIEHIETVLREGKQHKKDPS